MQLIFLCESEFDSEQVVTKNFTIEDLELLPFPNRMSLGDSFSLIGTEINAFTQNINRENPLLSQFLEELSEDYGIEVKMNENHLEEFELPDLLMNEPVHREGYTLEINSKRVILNSSSLHGLFNAFQTFRQLLTNGITYSRKMGGFEGFLLPHLNIVDWPSLKVRGVADDVSRGQIPTVESVKRFIKNISQFKNNYYAMYIEDVFQSSKHPKVGAGRGAFTPEEIMEIDEYAKSRFVTIFPILETLGHMDNILTIPEYEKLGEFPGAQSFAISNGNIYPFLRDYIEEISACFSSKIFHLGGDETFDLGHGRSRELIESVGIEQALYDHYMKLYRIAKENGNEKIVLYHDVVAKYPSLLERFPKDLVIMYWDYKPRKGYKKLKKLKESGLDILVSPSMLCWTRPFPDYESAQKNIINLIQDAKSHELWGQLNSTWGDFAYQNLRENNIYGAIISAAAGWEKEKIDYEKTLHAIGKLFYGFGKKNSNAFVETFRGLNALNQYYSKKISILPQPFFRYLYRHPFRDPEPEPVLSDYEQMIRDTKIVLRDLEEMVADCQFNEHFFQYIVFSAELVLFLGRKIRVRVLVNKRLQQIKEQGKVISPESAKEVITKLFDLKELAGEIFKKYEKLWEACAKRPNLDYPLERFQRLISFIEEKITEIDNNIFFKNPMLKSKYIWTSKGFSAPKIRYFRKIVEVEGNMADAKIQVIAGNIARVFVNGQYIGQVKSRFSLSIVAMKESVKLFDISPYLTKGRNVIGIEANHFLQSIGYINVTLEYKELVSSVGKEEGRISKSHTVRSNGSWLCSLGPFEETKWSTIDQKLKEEMWVPATVVGAPPDFNGDIYEPDLLSGKKSIPNDLFGLASNVYYTVDMFVPKFVSKFVRFFSKYLAKLI